MNRFLRKAINDFNIKRQAEELGVSVWQAPSTLFIMMGLVIMLAMAIVYYTTKFYDSPEVIVLSESAVVIILLTVGNFIIRNIEDMARTNKMKTEFVSIASHQLKTPLAEINWALELLLAKYQTGLTTRQIEIFEGINKSNARMTRLVNDLLDVARIDQGRLVFNLDKVDLKKAINSVIKNNQMLAAAYGIKLCVRITQDPPVIVADEKKLLVVLDNLISNAIKYTPDKGQAEVELTGDKKGVLVKVSDTGVGIPENQQDKIFEKFFRSNNVIKNQTEGTGLGLYISKNIIEQMGGKIWFYSKENQGTTFFFTLPVAGSN